MINKHFFLPMLSHAFVYEGAQHVTSKKYGRHKPVVLFHVMSRTVFYSVQVAHRVFRGFVDSLPACKASDASVLSIPDFTPHRMRCRFGVFGDSLESTALILQADFRFFSRGHDPITHVRRARFLTDVDLILVRHCHCHTAPRKRKLTKRPRELI